MISVLNYELQWEEGEAVLPTSKAVAAHSIWLPAFILLVSAFMCLITCVGVGVRQTGAYS